MSATLASRSYAALRQEGAPPWRARSELGLQAAAAARFERLFQARTGIPGKPRFARHRQHVAAVLAEGGYPVLPERRR
jgi:hypothetical protein